LYNNRNNLKFSQKKLSILVVELNVVGHEIPFIVTIELLSKFVPEMFTIVLYVPFNGNNGISTYYDCSNTPTALTVATNALLNMGASKITNYRTYLGSNPLQDDIVQAINPTFDAYTLYNKPYTINTPILNLTNYLVSFFHLDKFYTSNEIVTDDNNSALGVPMRTPMDYRVESNITSTNIDHTIFATFVRVIKLTPLGNTYSQ
jgi:hypothetical protein